MTALSAMPVKPNVLAVDAATGQTVPVEVVAKSKDEPNGPFVFKGTPPPGNAGKDVFVPATEEGGRWLIPAQAPGEETFTQGGQTYTRIYGSLLGSVYKEDPVVGIVRFLPSDLGWLKTILMPWVGILAATILLIATNAGLIGVSRLAYSLGQHRQVPPILGRVHPKRLTPYVAIIAFGIVACVLLMLPGNTISLLADLYAFGAMISFTVAHISVVWLRHKEPDTPRPFRTPINITVGKMSVPVLAVIGGLGTFTVWCVVVATHPFGRTVGFIWMGIGLVMYVAYRKAKGYSLTRTLDKVVVPVSMQADIDYHQILVPITGSRISDEMMVLACQLATEKKSAIDGLYVIEVPLNLPLDRQSRQRAGQGGHGARGRGAHRLPVQGQVHAARRHRAPSRAGDRRGGGHAPQRGGHARHDAQAAHRQPDLREDHGLRARQRSVRGAPQSRPEGLSYRGLERRGPARAAGAGRPDRLRRSPGRPEHEGLRRLQCMS